MSDLSDFRTVEDAAELAEQPVTNGMHPTNGRNGATNGVAAGGTYDAHAANALRRESSMPVDAEVVVPMGMAQSERRAPHHDTWGPDIPSLRIGQVGAADAAATSLPLQAIIPPPHAYDPGAGPPRALRPVRFVTGWVLLLGAWLATAGVLTLGRSLLAGVPGGMGMPFQFALYALTALGALWLVVVAMACLAAGAFALSLALTTRGW